MANLHDLAKKHQLKIPPKSESDPPPPLRAGAKRRPWNSGGSGDSNINQSQTEAKLEPEQSQTEAKLEPEQSRSTPSSTSALNETRAGTGAELEPNRSQTGANLGAKLEPKFGLLDLSTLQRKTIDYFFDSCRINGSRLTEPMLVLDLVKTLKSTSAAVKKAIQRIEGKQLAIRVRSKAGRGGWTIYELPEPVYKELIFRETRAKLKPNQSQTEAKLEPQLEPELEPNLPSSSSLLAISDFSKTTTAGSEVSPLPPEWAAIDCMPLVEQSCPFGLTQIRQARSFGMSPEALQESIYNFGWALTEGWEPPGGFQTSPLNFLMGCLRRNALFEHEGYYRQRRMRKDAE